jgi:hypothetical protein
VIFRDRLAVDQGRAHQDARWHRVSGSR